MVAVGSNRRLVRQPPTPASVRDGIGSRREGVDIGLIQIDRMLKVPDAVGLPRIDPPPAQHDAHPLARHPLKQERIGPPLKHLRLKLCFVKVQQPFDHPDRQRAAMALHGQRPRDHPGNVGPPTLFAGKTPCICGVKNDHAAGPRAGRNRRRHGRKPCRGHA